MAVPASLKAVKQFLDRAKELQGKEPVVAYHLRLHALNESMAMRSSLPKADMAFVIQMVRPAAPPIPETPPVYSIAQCPRLLADGQPGGREGTDLRDR